MWRNKRAGNHRLQRIVYLILHGIGSTQPLTVNMVFALCHVQPILTGEFLANLTASDAVVLVGDKMTVVVDAVENKVTVRMLTVEVAHEDVLGVLDVHPAKRNQPEIPPKLANSC